MTQPQPKQNAHPSGGHELFRAIWRWHFYAGIIFAPFLVLLAITGGVYLFKPQIESILYKDLYYVQAQGDPIRPSEQIEKVKETYPDAQITRYQTFPEVNRASEVGIVDGNQLLTVFVNPYDRSIVGTLNEQDRFMQWVRDLHNGQWWGGTWGNRIIELAACWAIILILTGLYLWWPRSKGVFGSLLPRFKAGRRTLWRDLHAVPAFWLSAGMLLLIFTGLPWSGVWGDMVNKIATATHTGYPAFAFSFGPKPESNLPKTKDVAEDVPWANENLPVPESKTGTEPLSVEKVMAIAKEREIGASYAVSFPDGPKGVFTVSTQVDKPEYQATLHIDQYSGDVLTDVRFNDYGLVAKAISIGIALHEGRYFGWVNQLLGLLVCLGIVGIAVTGFLMWWKRKPTGQLGAPSLPKNFRLDKGVGVIILALGILFPLVGLSLLLVLLLDWFVVRKIPAMKRWIG
jgi:uncharacterized iron-regulated membrane protein